MPAEVGILPSPPLPWDPSTSPPQLGHRAGCTGFLPLRNNFFKGSLGSDVDQHKCCRKEAPCFPRHCKPGVNGTNFCPTATDKLGLGEQSGPWGLRLSTRGPEEPMPMSPWLYGGSASMVSLPAEPQSWDLLSEGQK